MVGSFRPSASLSFLPFYSRFDQAISDCDIIFIVGICQLCLGSGQSRLCHRHLWDLWCFRLDGFEPSHLEAGPNPDFCDGLHHKLCPHCYLVSLDSQLEWDPRVFHHCCLLGSVRCNLANTNQWCVFFFKFKFSTDFFLLALYGVLFIGADSTGGFSNYRLWESVGFIVAYILQTQVCIEAKLWILVAMLGLGMTGYLLVEWRRATKA